MINLDKTKDASSREVVPSVTEVVRLLCTHRRHRYSLRILFAAPVGERPVTTSLSTRTQESLQQQHMERVPALRQFEYALAELGSRISWHAATDSGASRSSPCSRDRQRHCPGKQYSESIDVKQ
jgi:hypothetical protein